MNLIVKPPRKMTVDEFYEFVHRPENHFRWFDLVRGEVIELPPPNRAHGVLCANIAHILGNHVYAKAPGYVVSNDSGVVLPTEPATVYGPDVSYFDDAKSFEDLPEK